MITLPVVALATKIKIAVISVATIALVSACMLRDQSLRNEGAQTKAAEITRQSNEQGEKRAKRAAKVIRDAHAPGSFERLRRDPLTCPDCQR